MKNLSDEEEKVIFDVVDESHEIYQEGRIEESLDRLKDAWNLLPPPRENTNVSNVIASEISEIYLEDLKNYEEAIKWAKILIACYSDREIDDGDGEYTLGKIYYEMGEYEKAKEQFEIRLVKSDGNGLEDAPKEYRDLLKT
jgi:tetratricopeptide (TPR) repeat protein